MRPLARLFFATLLALTWTGLANAEPLKGQLSIEPGQFNEVVAIQLEAAFESFAPVSGDEDFGHIGGPTTMRCERSTTKSALETCVVTAEGTPSSPRLAQR